MGVRLERAGSAAIVVLDWPEQRNALGPDEAIAVTEVDRAAVPDDVCGVVLTGNGAFCAGGNLKGMAERSGMSEDDRRNLVYGAFQGLIRAIVDVPVTTIAAVTDWLSAWASTSHSRRDSRFVGPDGWCQQGWGKLGLIGGTGGELLLRTRAPGALWALLEDQPRLDGDAMEEHLGLGEAVHEGNACDRSVQRVGALAAIVGRGDRGVRRLVPIGSPRAVRRISRVPDWITRSVS